MFLFLNRLAFWRGQMWDLTFDVRYYGGNAEAKTKLRSLWQILYTTGVKVSKWGIRSMYNEFAEYSDFADYRWIFSVCKSSTFVLTLLVTKLGANRNYGSSPLKCEIFNFSLCTHLNVVCTVWTFSIFVWTISVTKLVSNQNNGPSP